jgi:hypothetical protein
VQQTFLVAPEMKMARREMKISGRAQLKCSKGRGENEPRATMMREKWAVSDWEDWRKNICDFAQDL